jgi:hypothetical protein
VSSMVTLLCLTSPLLVAVDRGKVPVKIQRRCHWARTRNMHPSTYGSSFGDFNAISSRSFLKTQMTTPSARYQWVWRHKSFSTTYCAARANLTSHRTAQHRSMVPCPRKKETCKPDRTVSISTSKALLKSSAKPLLGTV